MSIELPPKQVLDITRFEANLTDLVGPVRRAMTTTPEVLEARGLTRLGARYSGDQEDLLAQLEYDLDETKQGYSRHFLITNADAELVGLAAIFPLDPLVGLKRSVAIDNASDDEKTIYEYARPQIVVYTGEDREMFKHAFANLEYKAARLAAGLSRQWAQEKAEAAADEPAADAVVEDETIPGMVPWTLEPVNSVDWVHRLIKKYMVEVDTGRYDDYRDPSQPLPRSTVYASPDLFMQSRRQKLASLREGFNPNAIDRTNLVAVAMGKLSSRTLHSDIK